MSAHCKVCGDLIFDEDGQCYGIEHPPGSGTWVCDEDECRDTINLSPLAAYEPNQFLIQARREQAKRMARLKEAARRDAITAVANILGDDERELLSVKCSQQATGKTRGRLVLEFFSPQQGRPVSVVLHETEQSFDLRKRAKNTGWDLAAWDDAVTELLHEMPVTEEHLVAEAMNWLEHNAASIHVRLVSSTVVKPLWFRNSRLSLRDTILSYKRQIEKD